MLESYCVIKVEKNFSREVLWCRMDILNQVMAIILVIHS
jgi:hypothetical protein